MATCLTSINEISGPLIEMASDVTYPATINNTVNALFILSNDMDQSVFFTVRTIGVMSNISFSLTIYNLETLLPFGSLNITNGNVSTSFNIKAGQYYVCIRSQILPYNIEVTPKFISYVRVATFNARSYFGASAITQEIKAVRPVGVCTRRLLYTLIDGALPPGLTMLENGYITGYLPILDTDPYNADLPTSDAWYHKIGDDEYVTSWGRAYRFKVHLTLYDDRDKEDIRWFYITIVNDFSKNLALIDQYEMLDDERDVTFEEKIKLATLQLCPPCNIIDVSARQLNRSSGIGIGVDSITDETAITDITYAPNTNNGSTTSGQSNGSSNDNQLNGSSTISIDGIITDETPITDITYDKTNLYNLIEHSNNTKELFDIVKNNEIDDEDNILIFDADFNNRRTDGTELMVELILIPTQDNISFEGEIPTFKNIILDQEQSDMIASLDDDEIGLAEYYIFNYNNAGNDIFIEQLKDSSMYQSYLLENGIDKNYIEEFPLLRDTYTGVKLKYVSVFDELYKTESKYVHLSVGVEEYSEKLSVSDKNVDDIVSGVQLDASIDPLRDAADLFELMYNEAYNKLPMTPYNAYGWSVEARLVVEGK